MSNATTTSTAAKTNVNVTRKGSGWVAHDDAGHLLGSGRTRSDALVKARENLANAGQR